MQIDGIVLAGGVPEPQSDLYALTRGRPKALLPMGDRTMLERVVSALQDAPELRDLIVVGLEGHGELHFSRPVRFVPDQGGLIANVLAGVASLRMQRPDAQFALLSSADIPLLSGAIVSDFIARCLPLEKGIYYNFVAKADMERRFPGSNRTFTKLKGAQIAGGDMVLVDLRVADENRALWEALTNARKEAWKLARVIGVPFLLKFLLRRIGLPEIEAKAAQIIGHPVQIVLNPHAELGMDADKPEQVRRLQEEF
jgi:molybdopterin-guanine dinucleotide biosynthesis protein A